MNRSPVLLTVWVISPFSQWRQNRPPLTISPRARLCRKNMADGSIFDIPKAISRAGLYQSWREKRLWIPKVICVHQISSILLQRDLIFHRSITLTGGSLEPSRIPPSTHSKPCLPSTGSSSHTATKTHFAPDDQQLWRWKYICSLRAAPAERLQNCSSVQARRNSKGPTEYSKLPVSFCAVAMWERWKNIALV